MESDNKLTSVKDTSDMTESEVIIAWLKKKETPLDMVEAREGRAGRVFYYLRHQFVTDTLNRITGFRWSNEVLREIHNEDEVTVLVRLTLWLPGIDEPIVHEGYGGHVVARYAESKAVIPGAVTDAYNSAASKGLVKAATRLGLGLDLSIPIRSATLKRLNVDGSGIFKKRWDEVRPQFVRIAVAGRKKGGVTPITSSRDLMEIEGRLLAGAMEKNQAPLCKDLANLLRPIAAMALKG